jgi:TIR domain
MNQASVVLVLWSHQSVESQWVRNEAEAAADRNLLVPALIEEDVRVPLAFRRTQAANLVDWDGSPNAPGFQELLVVVEQRLGRPAERTASMQPVQVPPPKTTIGHSSSAPVKPSGPLPPDEVYLGVGAPRAVSPGEEFVVRLTAYTEACRGEVRRVIEAEAPSSHLRLDLETCRWRRGARVTVRLDGSHATFANPAQTFKWNGAWHVLRFDVSAHSNLEGQALILRVQVAVEGVQIAALRPEIEVFKAASLPISSQHLSFVEVKSPRSAFASYAREDRREVLGRIRSLQVFTGIDVLLDCLSIRPGEEWKPRLQREIVDRDIFWLFWSRHANDSAWVEWEWRTALAKKSIAGIQPHPLEPAELAPPPKELANLQFGAMYEWYLVGLRESWATRSCRRLWRRIMSALDR